MIDMNNLWFTFNLREDLLGGLKIGDKFDVIVPALKSQVIPVHVTMINVQGQYAAWRATRATGDSIYVLLRFAPCRYSRSMACVPA